ncbi:(2Fe-2S)-binding protein [Aliarcobacter butzleri]|uniref:(2Fe-2S)-binding protein n=6 Tax=root TaxID=1 RepID=A0AAP4PTR3_9BACT|nr:(2Fe-2S)-binding protein [Aliarcobacter butzleri]MCP3649256.1 (2Fe-2S)-binding protein [Arcobacter sp. DNRA7]AGR77545.1 hypothetical protein A7H1H_1249 [Aliarcobacter butzleri 7h1h]EFU69206.1 conserved hypothetical protein [Aliarcobacter butzleri JV22]KLD97179.1 (2Fe-2S)-binding protein [Aliarcobacter butzleri L349]KLE02271.1 (2Fe-2S)-binding protein [Aliarcobacter butzleri L351]
MSKSFPHSYVVCTCKQVTLGEIIYAIKEKGAKTLQDLEDITDAGSCCGSCKNEESDIGVEKMELYLEDILKKFS